MDHMATVITVTRNLHPSKPVPLTVGTGSPGIPQGYLCQSLQAALSLGKDLLNKYYSLSDDSEIYWIAIGMYS